jgi:hypothetical protein
MSIYSMNQPQKLPRLQEIVVPVSTADAMGPHAVLQQNQNKSIPMTWPSTLSEHGHPWDISIGIFKFKSAELVFVVVQPKEPRKV